MATTNESFPGILSATTKPYENLLRQTCEIALAWLAELDATPVAPTADVNSLRQRLGRALEEDGVPANQVIADLAAGAAGGIVGSAGGRFFGWVIGGAFPAAVAADWPRIMNTGSMRIDPYAICVADRQIGTSRFSHWAAFGTIERYEIG